MRLGLKRSAICLTTFRLKKSYCESLNIYLLIKGQIPIFTTLKNR